MRFTDRLRRTGAARWRVVVLAATLLATFQAITPATATASATGSAAQVSAAASPRYLNLHQCVYETFYPSPKLKDLYTTILRGSAGGTHISNVPETAVNCPPNVEGDRWNNAALSGVVALDLNAGRYLNLHQCTYYRIYHEWFTTILPTSAGGTNVSNVPETGANCPPQLAEGFNVPSRSGVVALDLTAGRYLNLSQCVYLTDDNDLATIILPWSVAGGGGGTNVSNVPDTGVNCQTFAIWGALQSLKGGMALDLQSPDLAGPVPNVLDWGRSRAVSAIQAAGFVAQTSSGGFDCGPLYVQGQSPAGGTVAPFGSIVRLTISRQPRPEDCP
ncbi:PASTA domain-containing protein [Nonomuraea rhizosphaerae]|uniref:PASTA domain-containing protein n=1 Tax=Nonomuraea rhizosphaerae TaxID=2665663 RepID=UPI001C5CDC19|nr:PASTA domain-containing protein [Nonomuraea rhizosphaerae]